MEKVIELESGDEALKLFGVYDRNLRVIREATGASVVVRDSTIRIKGEVKSVQRAFQTILRMKEIVHEGGEIAEKEVVSLLAPERETKGEDPGPSGRASFLRGTSVAPKTEGQQSYLDEIDRSTVVFSIGPAGTGKTFLAVAKAVEYLRKGTVRKVVLVRPAVEAGERLGFLPGDIQAKVNPYLRPIYDALNSFLEFGQLKRLIENDVVEIVPLAYMRGRTMDRAFIILDEAQNTTQDQMKMFLTRMGFGSRIVVTGDITQIDLPPNKISGLVDIQRVLKEVEGISFVYLTSRDIVRHPIVQRIVDAYERREKRTR
ncbi:MAG: hypothetical protein A2Z34_10065 [Planctomycetes bacterium RBG_16_59_8]|nr:MAG: hypothetical protein A2Z34_10065 [Planctomycetes bacterium RBG_16_59_8]